jgi:Prolyl oligopeptidase family
MVGRWFFCSVAVFNSAAASLYAAEISSSMIVEMQDITSVSRSPDGGLAVVGVCRENTKINKREVFWVIVPVRGLTIPIVVPGGQEILSPRGFGSLLTTQVQWASNGRSFFYPRRDGDEIQLWKTDRNGGGTEQVTHLKTGVIGVTATADREDLMLELAPDPETLNAAEDQESRNGILYDDHIIGEFPLTETLPVLDRWRSVRMFAQDDWRALGWTGTRHVLFNTRTRRVRTASPLTESQLIRTVGARVDGDLATVVPLDGQLTRPDVYAGQYTLQVGSPGVSDGERIRCALPECFANKITIVGRSPDLSEVIYAAESRSGRLGDRLPGMSALYAWNPNTNRVRLIRGWGDRLFSLNSDNGLSIEPMHVVDRELVVAAVGSDQPPRLEAIDLSTGVTRVIFDPNVDLRELVHGKAVWHTWPTSTPYNGRGIFVLPDNYQPGVKYPAIITTYQCGNGFLRGGGGDNAPEFVAAHLGFIAICIDFTILDMLAREPNAGRLYPVMCQIISDLIVDLGKQGFVDLAHVGLSGQSLGANAGAYCISHNHSIAAAAFRHGSAIERAKWDLFDMSAVRRDPVNGAYAKFGLPDPRNDPQGRWDEISVARRAREIDTPTLIQDDDTEYLSALPLFSAMRDENKAVELYVFPKETHLLMQPIHRLVNYERQLDWFRFWLKAEEDSGGGKREQYERWRRMREALGQGSVR